MVCEVTARKLLVSLQPGDGLCKYSKEMICDVTTRRWFVKSQQGDGL